MRARVRADLEALLDAYAPELEIVGNAGSDYRRRAMLPRERWTAVVTSWPTRSTTRTSERGRPRAGQ